MELKDYLNALNSTKQNIIRDAEMQDEAEKQYPAYVVQRTFANFMDTLLVANELNVRAGLGLLSNRQQFEYLLHAIPKGKRFSPWLKPEAAEERIQRLAEVNNCSLAKAEILASCVSEEALTKFLTKPETGGVSKNK